MTIRVYHCTKKKEHAQAIVENGFVEYGVRQEELMGIFVSNCPQWDYGRFVIAVDLEATVDDMFYQWELIEVGKPYREFVIRADIINRFPRMLLSDDEATYLAAEDWIPWNEYPPGEPEKTWAELDDGLNGD